MSEPNETWKPVPGYEMKYHVSDLGRVRSVAFGRSRFGMDDVT